MGDQDLVMGDSQMMSDEEDPQVVNNSSNTQNAWNAGDQAAYAMPMRSSLDKKRRGAPCIGGCWRMPPYPTIGLSDLKDPNFGRMLGAEYVGTMFLVFIGTMSIAVASPPHPEVLYYIDFDGSNHTFRTYGKYGPRIEVLPISFAFGIVYATMVQALGHISGAHLNPAVSFGLMINGNCSLLKALCYTVAQCLGSVTGALLTWLSTKSFRLDYSDEHPDPYTGHPVKFKPNFEGPDFSRAYPNWGMGANTLAPGVPQFPDGMMTEFLLTFLLVFTICAVSDDLRKDIKGSAPLAIGLAAFASHLAGYTITGSSINPARSFGPAIFSNNPRRWTDLWVYWVGPILGAMESGFVHAAFFNERPPKPDPPQVRIADSYMGQEIGSKPTLEVETTE